MFKWLGKVFASDKSLETGLSMIEKAGDALVYTSEEKANDRDKMIMHKDAMIANWIEASKGSNMSRRFLAFLVGGIWAFLFLFGWASEQAAIWSGKVDQVKLELMVQSNAVYLEQATGGMLLVLGFYFAAPYMGTIVSTAVDKFTGKSKKEDKS